MLSTVDVVDDMLTVNGLSNTPFDTKDDISMSKGPSGPDSDIIMPEQTAQLEKCKPTRVTAKLLLSRHSELSNYFVIVSANRIAHKHPFGEFAYRFHPEVLRVLQSFAENPSNSDNIQLLAGLLLEGWTAKSGSRNPLTDVEEIFCSLLGASAFSLPFTLGDIGEYVNVTIGEWSWKIFQCHTIDHFPDNVRLKVMADREKRYFGFGLLQLMLDQEIQRPPVAVAAVEEPAKMDLTMTPRKDNSAKEDSVKKTKKAGNTPQTTPLIANLPKISSFFSVVKKAAAVDKIGTDFFPPFQLRPNSTLAKINQFVECRTISRPSNSTIARQFRHVVGTLSIKRCTCYGIDGEVVRAVWKLLQFREDYRPAYYGTWTKKSAFVTGRRPFGQDKQLLDYDYDSETEWVEGALECDEDGESINGTEDEEEDEEEDETAESEDDGWLVLDGYLSDGEGVDEPLPDHLQPDFDPGMAPSTPREKEKQAKTKKKLVVLKVHINGPWISNGPRWSLYDSSSISTPFDPLLGADLLFKPSEFELSSEMMDHIKEDLDQNVKLEGLVEKLSLRFGKLPKRPLERRLALLMNTRTVNTDIQTFAVDQQLQGPGYTEFKLKLNSSTVEDLEHHVLILNSTSVSLSDLTVPIRLSRQPADSAVGDVTLVDDRNDDDPVGRDEDMIDPSSRRSNRRRTRIVSSERKKRQEEEEDFEGEESAPWVLEDGDAQHTFIGRREGGQQSNYVFFVNQGRDFLVVPASKWYRFNPKPAYRPLTTEEAEAQMAARGKNRLVLAQQLQTSRQVSPLSANEQGEDGGSSTKAVPKLKALRESMMGEAQVAASIGQYGQRRTTPPSSQAFMTAMGDHQMDEIDYDEVFDDDDGEGGGEGANAAGDEDDPSAPKPVLRMSRPAAKLSTAGKNLSKLVHSLDRKLVDYGVSDDERDPYADPDDVASDNDDGQLSDASSSQRTAATATPVNRAAPPHLGVDNNIPNRQPPLSRPASFPSLPQQSSSANVLRTASSSIASPEKKIVKPVKRTATEQLQQTTESRPVLSSSSQPSLSILTQEEIVGLLRNGPVRTKDLIHTLRDRLKHEASKEAFKDIIKRVASVRTGPGDDEKWLELKADYA